MGCAATESRRPAAYNPLMKAFRSTFNVALSAALLAIAVSAQAPQPTLSPNAAPQQPIPFDQAVRTGTLENGVKYFVRQNAHPEKRLSLRLAIKAGSLYE